MMIRDLPTLLSCIPNTERARYDRCPNKLTLDYFNKPKENKRKVKGVFRKRVITKGMYMAFSVLGVSLCCSVTLRTTKRDGTLRGMYLNFSKKIPSNKWDGISTRAQVHVLLEGNDNRVLDEQFPFVALFIHWNTEQKTASSTTVRTL